MTPDILAIYATLYTGLAVTCVLVLVWAVHISMTSTPAPKAKKGTPPCTR